MSLLKEFGSPLPSWFALKELRKKSSGGVEGKKDMAQHMLWRRKVGNFQAMGNWRRYKFWLCLARSWVNMEVIRSIRYNGV